MIFKTRIYCGLLRTTLALLCLAGFVVSAQDGAFLREHNRYVNEKKEFKKFDRNSHSSTLKELTQSGKEGKAFDMSEEEFSKEVDFFTEEELENYSLEPDEESGIERNFLRNRRTNNQEYDKVKYLKEERVAPPPRQQSDWNTPNWNLNTGWMKALMWIILALVVAYVLYVVFLKDLKRNPKADVEEREPDPSEIPLSELEMKLRAALAKKDYREAVRIYFLYILKLLINKNWISWHRKKTNMHYVNEMRNKPEFNSFSSAVGIFEIVWYGKRPVSEDDFFRIEPVFKSLVNELEK